jgi:hypothetical protein
MSLFMKVAIGLIAGYIIGIALGAFVAFVLDFESAARFVAIGCGLAGAALGPALLSKTDLRSG